MRLSRVIKNEGKSPLFASSALDVSSPHKRLKTGRRCKLRVTPDCQKVRLPSLGLVLDAYRKSRLPFPKVGCPRTERRKVAFLKSQGIL